jgi:hypothetical protein
MNNVYLIGTEYGTIVVSKKEYLYTKERVQNEICPEDELIINGVTKRYSLWKEEVYVNVAANETTTLGYKVTYHNGTIEEPIKYSDFEKSIIENKDNSRVVLKLVEEFLKRN